MVGSGALELGRYLLTSRTHKLTAPQCLCAGPSLVGMLGIVRMYVVNQFDDLQGT